MSRARLSAAAVRLAHSHHSSPAVHHPSPLSLSLSLSRAVSTPHHLAGTLQMASAAASCPYSTDTSDVSTPRSASPSPSVDSAKSSHTSISKNPASQRLTYRNPMAAVDISVIQDTMKLSALDQHRGYAQDHYGEVKQDQPTQYLSELDAAGYQIIKEPLWNKGKQESPLLGDSLSYRLISPLTLALRSCIHSRGARLQEPYRPPASHHGEPPDPEPACHEDDSDSPDSH